jgi:hypothetical protein
VNRRLACVSSALVALLLPWPVLAQQNDQNASMEMDYADTDPGAGQVEEAGYAPEEEPTRPKVSYLISDENCFGEGPSLLWPGFVTGMRETYTFQEKFVDPIGNPFYFESPFIESNAELVYFWHDFPTHSALAGGELNSIALQLRLALTDRLALMATKSGYSFVDSPFLGDGEGWNDVTLGLKYALLIDEPNEFILTSGIRWETRVGEGDALHGGPSGANELSPFISFGKGWDRWHLLGAVNYRVPMDRGSYNDILHWDLHLDYEIAPETLPGFFPLVELHGVHYFNNGDRTFLPVGGLDYTNLGSSDTAGDFMMWTDLGFQWKLSPNWTFGAVYGFPIVEAGTDSINQRVTVRLKFSI